MFSQHNPSVFSDCSISLSDVSIFILYHFHSFKRHQSRMMLHLESVGAGAGVFLVDHELLKGVQVCWDEGADGLVVISEDLLPSALGAHRAGGPDQAAVRSAVTLVETDKPQSHHSESPQEKETRPLGPYEVLFSFVISSNLCRGSGHCHDDYQTFWTKHLKKQVNESMYPLELLNTTTCR